MAGMDDWVVPADCVTDSAWSGHTTQHFLYFFKNGLSEDDIRHEGATKEPWVELTDN